MSKIDLTLLNEVKQLNLIKNYILQRGFHSDQRDAIDANDLVKKFKHDKFRAGTKRLKFFNSLLFNAVKTFGSVPGFQNKKIHILRINDENRMDKVRRKRN